MQLISIIAAGLLAVTAFSIAIYKGPHNNISLVITHSVYVGAGAFVGGLIVLVFITGTNPKKSPV